MSTHMIEKQVENGKPKHTFYVRVVYHSGNWSKGKE